MTDEKPTPLQFVQRMLDDARQAGSVDALPPVGKYASEYAAQVRGEVNADNVQAFLYGAAVVNLLVQETILRTSLVAAEEHKDGDPAYALYTEGCGDGAKTVAALMGVVIDDLINGVIEGPAYDRAFDGIVAQF